MPKPLVAFPCGSRSTTSTRFSCAAREAERFTAVVVFPTPPFWFTTARTNAMRTLPHGGDARVPRGSDINQGADRTFKRRRAGEIPRSGFRAAPPTRIFSAPGLWRGSTMKIACVLGQGFEDSEFRVPYDRLKGEGYQVDIVGLKAGDELKGDKGREKVKVEKSIDQVRADDYDALLIPGGYSPDKLRADRRMVEFVKQFDQDGKLIAAVCHGPQLLISARLVKGRTLTAWQTIQDDLQQIGANVKDEPVVRDRNWITSRKPDDLQQFSDAIVEQIEGIDGGLRDREAASDPAAHPS